MEVVFLNRALSQSPEDDLLLQMQGMFAEYERAKILERNRRGPRHAAQRGAISVLSAAHPTGIAMYAIRRAVVKRVLRWTNSYLMQLRQRCDEAGAVRRFIQVLRLHSEFPATAIARALQRALALACGTHA